MFVKFLTLGGDAIGVFQIDDLGALPELCLGFEGARTDGQMVIARDKAGEMLCEYGALTEYGRELEKEEARIELAKVEARTLDDCTTEELLVAAGHALSRLQDIDGAMSRRGKPLYFESSESTDEGGFGLLYLSHLHKLECE